MPNKFTFVLLKRLLFILSIILLTTLSSEGQVSREPNPETTQRIMKLYPNPAVSFIRFEFQKNFEKGYSIQIINFIGKQVYEAKDINASMTLDLATYNRGIYIYQLKDQKGKVVESGKFQVSK